jgi:LysR family transcriptional activator of nhaA
MARGFPGSLSGKPVILPTFDSKMRHDLEHWAKLNDVELNLLIESQDIAMKKLLAIQGVGLIPSAAHSVKTQVARGDLVKLGTPSGVEEQVFLLTAQRKIKNPIASAIMRLSIES